MYKKNKNKTEFGIGYINDEYILSFVTDFEHTNNVIEKKISLPTYTNVHNSKILYEYDGYLLTLNELRVRYLSKYYNIENIEVKQK